MAEATIGFLFKAASVLPAGNGNKTLDLLKSYYMMRCKHVSKGYGLPQKHFSEQIRCSHCCLEWKIGSEISIEHIKFSKRQRKRMKAQKNKIDQKVNLLNSKKLVQRCFFCRHITKTEISKPNKLMKNKLQEPVKVKVSKQKANGVDSKNAQTCDMYSSTVQVFSLNNEKNSLKGTIKEPTIIKNNKKRKDKFAGLCQKAVMASAKLKHSNERKDKQNKLSLFLKPSS